MSEIASQLLATFDSLPPQEQRELLAAMLRRSSAAPKSGLSDEHLVGLADEVLQGLDATEENPEPWYSARCIFRHKRAGEKHSTYEERIILIRADDDAHAIRRAEEEAFAYAASPDGVEYLEFVDAYHLFEETIKDGAEIFSLMRDSKLGPERYITRFFDTGSERSRSVDSELDA